MQGGSLTVLGGKEVAVVRLIPSVILTAVCMVCFCLPCRVGIPASGSEWSFISALSFSFFHANIFHLAVNLFALWRFIPRAHTCIIAYLSAVLTGMMPWVGMSGEPTYGLSAFLFAAYARMYVAWHRSTRRLIVIQILVGFIPHINWKAHLCAFIVSYLYWRAWYGKEH